MVLAGGLGVLVVIAFVGGVALGRQRDLGPGDRIAVVPVDRGAGLGVLVGRCADERVKAVEVRVADGMSLWRIESKKGGIDRRFVVGGEPPAFFATVTPLRALPPTQLEAVVTIDDTVDERRFDPSSLDDAAAPRAPCSRSDLGWAILLFAAGAAGVVVAYAVMVRRYLGTR